MLEGVAHNRYKYLEYVREVFVMMIMNYADSIIRPCRLRTTLCVIIPFSINNDNNSEYRDI